jgi:hypothetical protein
MNKTDVAPAASADVQTFSSDNLARRTVLFRLYRPEKPLFDQTLKLPEIERINGF